MNLPASMKFIDHGKGGDPACMQLSNGPLPTVKPGEVLIEVAYAGVNRPDVAQRRGHRLVLHPGELG
jgi:NADPH2:quinone reductase